MLKLSSPRLSVFTLLIVIAAFLLLGFASLTPLPALGAPLHGTPLPRSTESIAVANDTPLYYRDIKPIFTEHCMGCHLADGIGYAAVPMDDVTAILHSAEDIELAVRTRYMPPWMPGTLSPEFLHERKLADAEIAAISAWVEAGMPLGDPADEPVISETAKPTIREDVVVKMSAPYTPDDSLTDDYRCFLLDPGFTEDTYVTASHVIPGESSLVHHVILYQVGASARADAERLSEGDGRPGWQCFGGPNVGNAITNGARGSSWVAAWVPGSVPTIHPQGTGILISAGNLLVMQVHYNLEAGAKPDSTEAILQVATSGEPMRALRGRNVAAPVEIPCPADATSDACTRETAIQEGERALLNNTLLSRCGKQVNDYAVQESSAVISDCDYPVRTDGQLIAVAGHMHRRGTSFRLELNPDTPDAQIVLDIPYWDFHWQGSYQLAHPITVKASDTVRITCTWDNSKDPQPRYIVWGEGTEDEMCLGMLQILPEE